MSYGHQLNEAHHGLPSMPAGQPPPSRDDGRTPSRSGSVSVLGSHFRPMPDLESLIPQHFISMEAKNDQGLFETVLAASTGLDYSYASSSTVATLGLRKLPLSPTHNRRLFHTPFGIIMLEDFASFTVRMPEANVPEMDVNVAQDAEVRPHSAPTNNIPEREQLKMDEDVPALPPERVEVRSPTRQFISSETFAAIRNSINHGPAGRQVGRPVTDADLSLRATELTLVEPAAGRSRSTSGLGATPIFTTGGNTGSSPPSTFGLDRSRDSYNSSQCEHLAPINDSLGVLEPGTSPGEGDDERMSKAALNAWNGVVYAGKLD
ncbi:hypothetical protein BDP55DRAFT_712889 [Colletotrichum godetiae]|uniref:Uncharacterized protein n=1 Tax=Colletotrichum godetiae TaxID=1209918 RepID=A0AAJ0ASV1_9PEZI|nr:uncharacterized protein BDP55DRAFT_712889 [Colletotrichum godetiae]KAK1689153.1 hypothetical protein BDP55DRAFT_712889 [Colletotrichum godetiae]